MPELPEVETTRRGIAPHLLGQRIARVAVHQPRLRWPVPAAIETLARAPIDTVQRRAKYLLIGNRHGRAIVHLGMSGSLRLVADGAPRRAHDHLELWLASGAVLRYHDPRRFGCWLWQAAGGAPHPLLAALGPEPLGPDFHPAHLFTRSRRRRQSTKTFIMDNAVVVGVGNIYASEALYRAGLRPGVAAGRLSRAACERLHTAITEVLSAAIAQGGTTLRDFVNSTGEPGYFAQSLAVYGRAGEPCLHCGATIRRVLLGQRASYYCPQCQR